LATGQRRLAPADQQNHLADALFAATRHWTTGLHFNKGLTGAPPEAITASGDTATNPAVLIAFALAIIGGSARAPILAFPATSQTSLAVSPFPRAAYSLRKRRANHRQGEARRWARSNWKSLAR